MKKGERNQEQSGLNWLEGMWDFLKGGALAGIVTLLFLLACAFLVSTGAVREDWLDGLLLAGCIVGGYTGGVFTIRKNRKQSLIRGVAVGTTMFLLLLTSGVIVYGSVSVPGRGGAVLAASVCGGVLAAVTVKRPARKKRRGK